MVLGGGGVPVFHRSLTAFRHACPRRACANLVDTSASISTRRGDNQAVLRCDGSEFLEAQRRAVVFVHEQHRHRSMPGCELLEFGNQADLAELGKAAYRHGEHDRGSIGHKHRRVRHGARERGSRVGNHERQPRRGEYRARRKPNHCRTVTSEHRSVAVVEVSHAVPARGAAGVRRSATRINRAS